MRKEEIVELIVETHKNGTTSQKETPPYKIRVDYDAWLKVTRKDMLERGQEIVQIKRNGDIVWRRDPEPPQSPKSKPLY